MTIKALLHYPKLIDVGYMRRKLGFLDMTDEEFVKGCEQYGVKYYRRADYLL